VVLGADRFAGRSVLDVGAFDGFYSFLAEARGARRVVAVDNEQYVDWVRARFGETLRGGVAFRTIAGLMASRVEYRRMDALDVDELGERFDVATLLPELHPLVKELLARSGSSGARRDEKAEQREGHTEPPARPDRPQRRRADDSGDGRTCDRCDSGASSSAGKEVQGARRQMHWDLDTGP